MNYRRALGCMKIVEMWGEFIGVKQSELNDNIFIDTSYRADKPRCYMIKKGEHKGKKMFINKINKIHL